MKAMVLQSPKAIEKRPLQLQDVSVPEPLAGEIRIKVSVCGVCHTDLHTVEGDLALAKLPRIPGHQVVGRVEAIGEGVRQFHIGERVGVPWLYSTDEVCEFCLSGQENLCERARFTGLDVNGGYAEAMVVGEGFAFPVPEVFDDAHLAPLLCGGVIGYRAFRISGARSGRGLGLYGFGASAHIVLQLARHHGCEVYVFTRSERHRALARELGAVWAGGAEESPPGTLDAAIIFAPAGTLVPQALRAVRKGGTVTLAGITMSVIPELDYELIYHEKVLRSVANSTREDVRHLLESAAEIPICTQVQEYPLEQANEALTALKRSEIKGAAVLRVSDGR